MAAAKDIITLSLGLIGTVLGIVNTYIQLNTRSVRLKVIPSTANILPGEAVACTTHDIRGNALAIEVINLSTFAVTIDEVGFQVPHLAPRNTRIILREPIIDGGKKLPIRLESRGSFTAYTWVSDIPKNIGDAFARTACDYTFTGNTEAFKAFRRG